ncbi:hypothetical protein BJ742DRAFT_875208 [Cladochytrium replicatum]|nr:hypothetical protein BJ742DRAFT_875208 [Cladochytrium replicatum]
MPPTPKDYPSFRNTFAKNKRDGTLDQLPVLIWAYRLGAAGFVIYSAYHFFGLIIACNTPVREIGSDSTKVTGCESAAQFGILYAIVIEIILMGIILIGHLACVVLSVFVMRWRKQWMDFYESKSTQPPFHPGRAFMYFTAASIGNAAFLLLTGVIFFSFRAIGGGFGFALVGVVGCLYAAYVGRQLWSIDFDQPLRTVYLAPMPYDNGVIDPALPQPYNPPAAPPQPYNPAGAPPQPYNPAGAPPQPYNPAAAPPQPYNSVAAPHQPYNPAAAQAAANPNNTAHYPPQP